MWIWIRDSWISSWAFPEKNYTLPPHVEDIDNFQVDPPEFPVNFTMTPWNSGNFQIFCFTLIPLVIYVFSSILVYPFGIGNFDITFFAMHSGSISGILHNNISLNDSSLLHVKDINK